LIANYANNIELQLFAVQEIHLRLHFISRSKTHTNSKMAEPGSPTLESLPKVDADLKSELESFKPSLMKSVSTSEKVVLPTAEDVAAEKTQVALLKGVEDFDQNNLKHTKTQEKIVLPDAEVIESEKGQLKLREGIETFDPKNMKHVETQEKNPLPTKEIIDQEKQV